MPNPIPPNDAGAPEHPHPEHPQVAPDHYLKASYDTKERFVSYWHQIDELRALGPASVLEVGIGNGFVSSYLRARGLAVTTLDFDERLEPDVVGSVLEMPFEDGAFSAVACFEVLEHLPYDQFAPALREMRRVAAEHVVLSLPNAKKVYRFELEMRHVLEVRALIPRPRLALPEHTFDGEHYWEIGTAGHAEDEVRRVIERAGFAVERAYRVFEFPYHHFFVLRCAA